MITAVALTACSSGGSTPSATASACTNVAVDPTLPAEEITITLDPQVAALDEVSRSIAWCSAATGYPPLPTLEAFGYTFEGWTFEGSAVSSGGELSSRVDHTLTADFTPDGVQLTYVQGQGTFLGTTDTSVNTTRLFGGRIVADNFVFPVQTNGEDEIVGAVTQWEDDQGNVHEPFDPITWTDARVMTPRFGTDFVVLLDAGEGQFNSGQSNQAINLSLSGGTPIVYGSHDRPVLEGYALDDWKRPRDQNFIGSQNGDLENAPSLPEPHILTAVWLKRTTVRFELNAPPGVTPEPSDGVQFAKQEVLESKVYGTLPTATLTGYTFEGWFRTANADPSTDTPVTANSTKDEFDEVLYAAWSSN